MAELHVELRGDDQVWLSGPCDPDAYARLCDPLVREGRVAHSVEVAADDAAELDCWYGLSFGRQQVYAERQLRPGEEPAFPVRPGTIEDAVALGRLLPEHVQGPPVWSSMPLRAPDELRRDWEEFLAEPGTTYFVAELDGRAAAYLALVHEVERTTVLAVAATLPETRGRGAMRALWAAASAWALEHGYERCEIDWRSTNLEAGRCWTALGFRPTRYRLHRLVGR
ncbi:MAG: GNAT family N-acetyltransferase [Gaiellaceae bacterium]